MTASAIESADVAVVGGGIMGCATAWHLATRGKKVALFERAGIGAEQSSRAWGFIRQQGRHEAEVPLSSEANRFWVDITARYGVESTGFTPGGILVPAETSEDEERIADGFAVARRMGLETELLDGRAVRELIPEMSGSWRSGLYTRGDAHGEPALSTRTIARAARDAGATLNEQCPVMEIDVQGGSVAGVVMTRGRCAAPIVVIACGVGSRALANPLGINLPIQIARSSVAQTDKTAPFTRVAMWGPKVAFRPRIDGSFVIGNGYRGVGIDYDLTIDSLSNLRHFLPAYRRNWRLLRLNLGRESLHRWQACFAGAAVRALPEPHVNGRKVAHNAAAFRALFPHVGPLGLDRTWAGRLDLTPDAIPIIDQPGAIPGLFMAAGFSGHGFALGPSVGKQMAEWIVDGRPSLDLAAFRLLRFAEGATSAANKAL
jgi:glycine/D-amino acid oxidase-like deaminating enzyme